MSSEISWSEFDRTVQHYACVSTYIDQLHDLGRVITEKCSALAHREPTLSDLANFLSPIPVGHTEVARHTAWIGQHVFRARAWCVDQKILMRRRSVGPFSPIVRQVERLSFFPADRSRFRHLDESWPQDCPRQDKVDAVLIDPSDQRVALVQGQGTGAAKSLSRDLRVATDSDRAGLFGLNHAVLSSVFARSDAVSALVFAKQILAAALPQWSIQACVLTYEEAGLGRFQVNDVSNVAPELLRSSRIALDDLPVFASHEDFKAQLDDEPEALLGLPNWADAGLDYLRKAPLDLPIRSIMLLKVLQERQRSTERKLCLLRPSELARLTGRHYGFDYPRDMWRHDILRLQRSGLVGDAPDGTRRVGLTATGLARVIILDHRFNRLLPRPTGSILLELTAQEGLWLTARVV